MAIERTVPDDVRTLIPGAAAEGAQMAGVSMQHEPAAIVAAINQFVAAPPKSGWFKKPDLWNERALPLGALWGIQFERQFGWTWVMIEEDGESNFGVFSADRSIGVFPFDYVHDCLASGAYPTILLAFNMLVAGNIPPLPAGGFENLMDGVQHVVPPR